MNNNSVAINWEEPSLEGPSKKWDEIASALRSNPGRWAKIAENKSAGQALPLKRRGDFEFKMVSANRGYKRGYMDIYARFPAGDSDE